MASFMRNIGKIFRGGGENRADTSSSKSITKTPKKSLKPHQAGTSIIKSTSSTHSKKDPFEGKTIAELRTMGYEVREMKDAEATSFKVSLLFYSRNASRFKDLFGKISIKDDEWRPLVEADFFTSLGNDDAHFFTNENAMHSFVNYLKEHTDIDQLNFSVISGNIHFNHLNILVNAKLNGELPHITLLTFADHQLHGKETEFEALQSIHNITDAADARGADVYIAVPDQRPVEISKFV